jgi:hypothetical protein
MPHLLSTRRIPVPSIISYKDLSRWLGLCDMVCEDCLVTYGVTSLHMHVHSTEDSRDGIYVYRLTSK